MSLRDRFKPEPTDRASVRFSIVKCLSVAGAAVGAVILLRGFGTFGQTAADLTLVGPGVAMLAVSLTAFVASAGVVTWSEQRQRGREQTSHRHQEDIYVGIVEGMTLSLASNVNPLSARDPEGWEQHEYDRHLRDGMLRANALLWADASTIRGIARWRQAVEQRLVEQQTLPREQWTDLQSLYVDVVMLMRQELLGGQNGLTRDVLVAGIFSGAPPITEKAR